MLGTYLLLSQQKHLFHRRIRTLYLASLLCAVPFIQSVYMVLPGAIILTSYLLGLSPNQHQRLRPQIAVRSSLAWIFIGLLIFPALLGFKQIREASLGFSNSIWSQYFQKKTMKGFNPVTEIGSLGTSLSQEGNGDIMIRVKGPQAPLYLRGMSYQRYHDDKWLHYHKFNRSRAVSHRLDHQIFQLDSQLKSHFTAPDYTVILNPELKPYLFYELNSRWIGVLSDVVRDHPSRHFEAQSHIEKGFYYFGGHGPQIETDTFDLQLPEKLKESLRPLITEFDSSLSESSPVQLPLNATETKQWLSKMSKWFLVNFKYSYDVPSSPNRNPMLAFLQDHRQGFCEYFASAGVLLARTKGIRARFVKGFAYPDQVQGEAFYYRKNAHAWMEVYIPQQGWVEFDPTPPLARPILELNAWYESLLRNTKHFLRDIGNFFSYGLWKVSLEQIRTHTEEFIFHYLASLMALISLLVIGNRLLTRKKLNVNYHTEYSTPERFKALNQEIQQDFSRIGKPCPEHQSYGNHLLSISKNMDNSRYLTEIHAKITQYEKNRFQ